jgi:hypothetical protein
MTLVSVLALGVAGLSRDGGVFVQSAPDLPEKLCEGRREVNLTPEIQIRHR